MFHAIRKAGASGVGTTGVGTVPASVLVGTEAASKDTNAVVVEKGKVYLVLPSEKKAVCG